MRKINALPIGYSDVKEVIKTGYYVDKTAYAQDLIEKQNPIFIARPRRFGKSLFIDTLATILCSGEKEIFQDCYIGNPENGYEWKKYPVIRLDFSGLNKNPNQLENSLNDELNSIADSYGITVLSSDIQGKLKSLVKTLSSLSNGYDSKLVVLNRRIRCSDR